MPAPLEFLQPKSLKHLRASLDGLIKGRLWVKILLAMAMGVAFGLALGPSVGWVSRDFATVAGHWPYPCISAMIQGASCTFAIPAVGRRAPRFRPIFFEGNAFGACGPPAQT